MPNPKFNLSNTRSRILKNWREFRGVRNRDIWYMRKHPASLLAISALLGQEFCTAIEKVPAIESPSTRMRVHFENTSSDEENSFTSDVTQYEDALTIHESDSVLSVRPNLEEEMGKESTPEPEVRTEVRRAGDI